MAHPSSLVADAPSNVDGRNGGGEKAKNSHGQPTFRQHHDGGDQELVPENKNVHATEQAIKPTGLDACETHGWLRGSTVQERKGKWQKEEHTEHTERRNRNARGPHHLGLERMQGGR